MYAVAVLCGGQGTRLREVTGDDLPKALVEVAGRAFIDLKLDQLRAQGFTDVVLCTGFGGARIEEHVGDGSRYGLQVAYRHDGDTPLGTGGAVRAALDLLGDPFWVTYGDTLLAVEPRSAEVVFRSHSWDGLMTVLHNCDRWGTSNALVEGDRVVAYAKDPVPAGAEHIDYGMVLLGQGALAERPPGPFDLADVLTELAAAGRLGAVEVSERFLEIGTPESLTEVRTAVQEDGA